MLQQRGSLRTPHLGLYVRNGKSGAVQTVVEAPTATVVNVVGATQGVDDIVDVARQLAEEHHPALDADDVDVELIQSRLKGLHSARACFFFFLCFFFSFVYFFHLFALARSQHACKKQNKNTYKHK